MKILIDMNLSYVWAEIFASHDIEAIHWSRVGAAAALDSEIMEFARLHGYAIFTHDLDFGTMLAENRRSGPSVIQLRTGDVIPDSIIPLVINAMKQCAAEIEDGAIITIDQRKTRVTLLPL